MAPKNYQVSTSCNSTYIMGYLVKSIVVSMIMRLLTVIGLSLNLGFKMQIIIYTNCEVHLINSSRSERKYFFNNLKIYNMLLLVMVPLINTHFLLDKFTKNNKVHSITIHMWCVIKTIITNILHTLAKSINLPTCKAV